MWALTITLKGTRHQIVLGYESKESMSQAWAGAASSAGERHIKISDDFGQTAMYTPDNLAFITETDLEEYEGFDVARRIAAVKTDNAYQRALGADPTLSFLVGGQNPGFLRK